MATRIFIGEGISLDEGEVTERFVRASGPGGQNVNKVSSAVQIRFDAARSPSLPDEVKARLRVVAGRRMSANGVLAISASRFRTQAGNRRDALERLVELIRKALVRPRPRRATKPTAASRERRLVAKRVRARTKRLRRTDSDL